MSKEVIIDGIKYIPEKALNEDTVEDRDSITVKKDYWKQVHDDLRFLEATLDANAEKVYTKKEVDAIREETGFWTDELVHEYTSRVILNKDNYGTAENAIQKFKKSKQPPLVDNSNIPDEILSEWITKARPLVDSAYNVGIDEAMRVVRNSMVKPEKLSNNDKFIVSKSLIIKKLTALKKDNNG